MYNTIKEIATLQKDKRLSQLGYYVLRIQAYDIKTDLNNVTLAIEAIVLGLEEKLETNN